MSSSSLRVRLAELLSGDLTVSEDRLTDPVAAPVNALVAIADSEAGQIDRVDRSDRTARRRALNRGRFEIGRSYKAMRLDVLHRLSDKDRDMLNGLGFPRAAPVVCEGEGILIADLNRFLTDGRFLVLGFMDFPEPSSQSAKRKW